ncbi:trafficking protein Pga2 [Schizosaccharomyces cryophilus OY26]|uniref:Trafficking protein Pga2 n=1 Tax=Schizosaccharomyces cryophilus (strain OY26 / ATCC MYA-4695 / CBS 11777 / NBRC 106824 / NRRL Y48691) TaxID=653667 RepID=S9VMK4_SCHCR|nr:trafficking protein Pga2 [Schizosaccharomyces cryophilus OY26]EPY49183.1 trafficking protein Pga2 [Schizosaccharomyces cryophilus OY26]
MNIDFTGYLQSYTIKDWIRICIYICGYLLLRPYLMKIGEKLQEKDHKRSEEQGYVDPQMTHGRTEKFHGEFDTDDEDEKENPDAEFRWGYSARRRIRKQREEYFKNQNKSPLDAYTEDDNDADIQEHLQD